MAYETIKTDQDGGAFVITLNRPKVKNAISTVTMGEIMDAAAKAEADETVLAVVITGGPEYFAAGADLNDALAIDTTRERLDYFRRWHRLCAALENLDKPVIAAIEGFCITGGLELALACDIRMAASDAKFGLTETRLGLIPGGGGTQRLSRLIGLGPALDLVLTADRIDAQRAYELGLVTRLSADREALVNEAMALAASMAERPPAALAYAKEAMVEGYSTDLRSGLRLEKALFALLMGTQDRIEAAEAFKDKRQPVFKGR